MAYVAFKTYASDPQKPSGMPSEWPWGAVIDLGESQQPPDQSGEWQVMSVSAFDGYKAIYRPAFNAYLANVQAAQVALEELKLVSKNKVIFCEDLLLKFKQKNISDGINAAQAIWLHHKIRALDVNYPGLPPTKIDVLNIALSGDVEAGLLALMYCVPDDMTETYHWLSAERVAWLVAEIQSFLGA